MASGRDTADILPEFSPKEASPGRPRMALRVDPVQVAHQIGLSVPTGRGILNLLYAKTKPGFYTMPRDRARALSRLGTRTITDLANDYAFVYEGYIRAAVREVGHNYRQVAKWLTRERIPAQRWEVGIAIRQEPRGALRTSNRQAYPDPLQQISHPCAM
jgi:hypothetical protein